MATMNAHLGARQSDAVAASVDGSSPRRVQINKMFITLWASRLSGGAERRVGAIRHASFQGYTLVSLFVIRFTIRKTPSLAGRCGNAAARPKRS